MDHNMDHNNHGIYSDYYHVDRYDKCKHHNLRAPPMPPTLRRGRPGVAGGGRGRPGRPGAARGNHREQRIWVILENLVRIL